MQNDLDDILNVKIDDDSRMRDILGRLKLNNDYKLYLEFLTAVKKDSINAGTKLTTTIMRLLKNHKLDNNVKDKHVNIIRKIATFIGDKKNYENLENYIDILNSKQESQPPSQDVTPQSQVVTPQSQVVTPQSQDVTPQSQDVTPQSQVVTPQSQVVTPQSPDVTLTSNVKLCSKDPLTKEDAISCICEDSENIALYIEYFKEVLNNLDGGELPDEILEKPIYQKLNETYCNKIGSSVTIATQPIYYKDIIKQLENCKTTQPPPAPIPQPEKPEPAPITPVPQPAPVPQPQPVPAPAIKELICNNPDNKTKLEYILYIDTHNNTNAQKPNNTKLDVDIITQINALTNDEKSTLRTDIIDCLTTPTNTADLICSNQNTQEVLKYINFILKINASNFTLSSTDIESDDTIIQQLIITKLKPHDSSSLNTLHLNIIKCYIDKPDDSKKLTFLKHLCTQTTQTNNITDDEKSILDSYTSNKQSIIEYIVAKINQPTTETIDIQNLCQTVNSNTNLIELVKFLSELNAAKDTATIVAIRDPEFFTTPMYNNLLLYKLKTQTTPISSITCDGCIFTIPTYPDFTDLSKNVSEFICCQPDKVKFGYIRYIDENNTNIITNYGLNNSICKYLTVNATKNTELRTNIIACYPPIDFDKQKQEICNHTNVLQYIQFIKYLSELTSPPIDNTTSIFKNLQGLLETDDIVTSLVIKKIKSSSSEFPTLLQEVIVCYLCKNVTIYDKLALVEYLIEPNAPNVFPTVDDSIKQIIDANTNTYKNAILNCIDGKPTSTLVAEICSKFNSYDAVNKYIEFIQTLATNANTNTKGTDDLEKDIKILSLKSQDEFNQILNSLYACLHIQVLLNIKCIEKKSESYIKYLNSVSSGTPETTETPETNPNTIKFITLLSTTRYPITEDAIKNYICPKNVDVESIAIALAASLQTPEEEESEDEDGDEDGEEFVPVARPVARPVAEPVAEPVVEQRDDQNAPVKTLSDGSITYITSQGLVYIYDKKTKKIKEYEGSINDEDNKLRDIELTDDNKIKINNTTLTPENFSELYPITNATEQTPTFYNNIFESVKKIMQNLREESSRN